METWKDITGYEGLYQVSNYGRVRSLDRTVVNKHGKIQSFKGKILSQGNNGKNYMHVNLWEDGKSKQYYVHRLVAETFIGYIPEGYAVNHLDFDTTNNELSNLEIVTYSENNNYSSEAGRYANRGGTKVEILYNDASRVIYNSIIEAAKETGIYRDTFMKILSGKSSGKPTMKKHDIKSIKVAK